MKTRIPFVSLCMLMVGMFSQPAYADSAASIIKEQNEKLQQYGGLGDVEMYCKHKPKASIDIKSFSKALGMKKHKGSASDLYSHCATPLKTIRDWCAEGYDKPVKEQISSYVCRYDDGPSKMTLRKGVLTMTTSWTAETAHYDSRWRKSAIGAVLRKGSFSLSQAALIHDDNERLKSMLLDMKRGCDGHKVKWKVDWKSFKQEIDKRVTHNGLPATHPSNNLLGIWRQCLSPLTALEQLCSNGQTKLMRDQVSSFVCRFDKNAGSKMVLKDKVLTLTSDFKMDTGPTEWGDILVGATLRDGEFSVRQAAFIRGEDADFKRLYSAKANDRCNTKIAWSIDWKSLEGEMDKRISKKDKTSIYSACGVPLDRLADVCGSDRKNKVKKKIKAYTCVFGGDKKQKLTLSRGTLQYHVDFGAKDSYGAVDTFLVKTRIVKKKPKPKKLSPKDLAKIRRILGEGANTQRCYRACDRVRGARAKQQCRNKCQ